MKAEGQSRVEQLVEAALELDENRRGEFLKRQCAGDENLRAEVESLLVFTKDAEKFMEASALQVAARALANENCAMQQALEGQLDNSAEGIVSNARQSPIGVGQAGRQIGAYTLVSHIGTGGMGTVWLAERNDGRFERRTAVKFLNFAVAGHGGEERFKREGTILGRLTHPHIAELLDAGLSPGGEPFLVLEHVDGDHIDRYCNQHELGIGSRISLFLDVLAAVEHAHANLIVHRDIKPSNVFVRRDGQVKLLDFGVAKLLESQDQSGDATLLTREAGGPLTPEYAAPEQVTGGPVTTATDVYSSGVLLYVLLTGEHPAGTGPHSAADLIKAIVDTEPPRMSNVVSSPELDVELRKVIATQRGTTPEKLRQLLRGDLDTIVAKALNKNPQQRYSSVTTFADDLRRYSKHEPIRARPDTIAYRAAKFVRRNRVAVALATLALAAAVAGVVGTGLQARAARAQRDFAYRERDRASLITEFVTKMFKVSDPSEARGNSITAREILDRASKEIDAGMTKDPEVQAQMMFTMGAVYSSLGLYARAQPLLERSAEIRQRVLGSQHPSTLQSRNNLGIVLYEEGRYQEAERLDRETLEIERRTLGPEHLETVKMMNNLADVLDDEGRYADAEKLFRDALEIARRTFGTEHVATLNLMANLALPLYNEGRFAEAEQLLKQALEISRRALGPENPDTLKTMGNLAVVLSDEGRLADAEKLDRETLEIKRRIVGPEHQETLRSMGNLAETMRKEGKYADAEKLQREALAVQRRTLGTEHPETLRSMTVIAEILKDQHKYAEAETLQRETIAIQRRALGADHPDTAFSTYNLANILMFEGKREEALVKIRAAIDHGLAPAFYLEIEKAPAFKSLRDDPRFAALITQAKERAAATQESPK